MINQVDIPKNLTSNINKNFHSSSPKPWPLLEKMVKHCIIGRNDQDSAIPKAESTFTMLNTLRSRIFKKNKLGPPFIRDLRVHNCG